MSFNHLQQQRRHLAVRLLKLVEQKNGVGAPPNSLGQLAALLKKRNTQGSG